MFENFFNEDMMLIIAGLLIPIIGCIIGSATVFLLKSDNNAPSQKFMLGFAAGVMLAAIIWSLMQPAMELAEEKDAIPWLSPTIGFLLGMGFLLLIDSITPHLHQSSDSVEGLPSKLKKSTMLILAITIHHIPEGMAIGVVLSGAIDGGDMITGATAIALSVGMALQNIPEGAVVSAPLNNMGVSKFKSFLWGSATGLVQPISAIITMLLIDGTMDIFPAILAFAGGAMLYVIIEEIIPEGQSGKHSNVATIGAALGFALMMVLDGTL